MANVLAGGKRGVCKAKPSKPKKQKVQAKKKVKKTAKNKVKPLGARGAKVKAVGKARGVAGHRPKARAKGCAK